MNARLRDGQFPTVAAALIRVPGQLSGVHGELYEILRTTSVDPKNVPRMAQLNEERAAIIHEAHTRTIADDGTRLPAPIFEISQERAKRMAWAEVERRARNEQ